MKFLHQLLYGSPLTMHLKKLRLILTMTYMEVGRLAVVACKTCSSSLGWLRHVTSSFGSET